MSFTCDRCGAKSTTTGGFASGLCPRCERKRARRAQDGVTARTQFLADLAAVCKRHGVTTTQAGFKGDHWILGMGVVHKELDGPPRCPDCGDVLVEIGLRGAGYAPNWCPACKRYVP